jgi:pyrroline-5-carboxylate reductase
MIEIGNLAFIGGGNMAAALIGGLRERGVPQDRIIVADPSAATRAKAQALGVRATGDNHAAVRDADVVILAVKPQILRAVALDLAPVIAGVKPLLISVAAGITTAALAQWFGAQARIVRAMPNRPALHGVGATGLYAPTSLTAVDFSTAENILEAVGATVWVAQESQMDTVTALSGSGPAYFFAFMEALEAAARAHGLPHDVALKLTLETAYGAARMARNSSDSLAELRMSVTSKGGTTAAALAVLAGADLDAIVARAVAAAAHRSAELAAEFGTP